MHATMNEGSSKKPGRPAGPPGHSPGEYLRGLRARKGWTIRELAKQVDLPESSAAYISQLEAGNKVPNADLARRLAERLGDELGVFRLWSMTARRSNPFQASSARRELARLLDDPTLMYDPRFGGAAQARFDESPHFDALNMLRSITAPEGRVRWVPLAAERARPTQARLEPGPARTFRVPILPEGTDPGPVETADARALESRAIDFLIVSLDEITGTSLHRPFAYRLTETGAAFASTVLRPGDVVVVTRAPGPVARHEIYAVRHEERVLLTHAAWNGRELLLLPDADRSDFVVIPAPDKEAVGRHVLGHVAKVIRGPRPTAE